MDFRFSETEEKFRQELLEFLDRELPAGWDEGSAPSPDDEWAATLRMRRKLAERGWLTMHWPRSTAVRGPRPYLSLIFNEEMSYRGAPGRDAFGARMLGPTLMIYGTEEQKRQFLPSGGPR